MSFRCYNSHEALYGGRIYSLYVDAVVVLALYVQYSLASTTTASKYKLYIRPPYRTS